MKIESRFTRCYSGCLIDLARVTAVQLDSDGGEAFAIVHLSGTSLRLDFSEAFTLDEFLEKLHASTSLDNQLGDALAIVRPVLEEVDLNAGDQVDQVDLDAGAQQPDPAAGKVDLDAGVHAPKAAAAARGSRPSRRTKPS